MLQVILYTAVGILLLFFLLPTIIALRLERPLYQGPLNLQLDWSFFTGIAGLRLHFQTSELHLYPLFLSWHPGLLRLQLRGGKTAQPKKPKAPKTPDSSAVKPAAKKQPPDSPFLKRFSQMTYLFIQPGLSFLKHLRSTVKPYKLRLSGHFGFDDPAKTGKIYGYVNGLKMYNNKNFYLDLRPDFESPGMRGQLDLKLRLHLGYLIFLALVFAARVGFRWLAMRFSFRKLKPA